MASLIIEQCYFDCLVSVIFIYLDIQKPIIEPTFAAKNEYSGEPFIFLLIIVADGLKLCFGYNF